MRHRIAINSMALNGKLESGDPLWREYNGSFRNKEWDEFDIGDAILNGQSYTSWHRPEVRKSDNWECAQFVSVDLDNGTEESHFEKVRRNEFAKTYASIIYTTPSHSESNPRCRVVFLLDEAINSPTGHREACRFMSDIFRADMSATDPSRFFYGNRDAELIRVGKIMPLRTLRTYYRQWEGWVRRNNKRALVLPRKTYASTEQVGGDVVRDVLYEIDPMSISYGEWITALFAVKHELGDAGYALAEGWAQDEGNFENRWNSIRNMTNPPTLGTLKKLAKHGRLEY